MHWLPAAQSLPAEIRIYDQLFVNPTPDPADFVADLKPQSLEILTDGRIEPAIAQGNGSEPMQFERLGYFVHDKDSRPDHPVFIARQPRARLQEPVDAFVWLQDGRARRWWTTGSPATVLGRAGRTGRDRRRTAG